MNHGAPSPLDALMYHDPSMRLGLVLHLTGKAPSLDRLAEHVRKSLAQLPVLSLTIKGRGTKAAWRPQSPGLDHHVQARKLPAGANVHDAVRELHREVFAEDQPPWTITLLHGHAPGTYVIVYRITHGLQDIGGMTRTLEVLFSHHPIEAASSSATVRTLCQPSRSSLRDYARAGALLARSTRKSPLWPHPDHGYSSDRDFHWTAVPTNALRDLAHPHGGSANDAFLTTLARATCLWAGQHHPHYDGNGLPVTLAINNRRPATADAPGNDATAGQLNLPGHNQPLTQALADVVAATRPLKQAPHREAIRRLSQNIPPTLMNWSFEALLSPARAAVLSSHFVIRHQLSFAGDPIHAVEPITALPLGAPVSVLIISYQGSSRAVFVTDAVLPEAHSLHRQWKATVEEAPY
ncbi:protein of unknown function UPF0089 [Actinobacteria bacterium OV450]|nr:protein of unknown function UPF0089 [Actinobacteria bacterium OV450]